MYKMICSWKNIYFLKKYFLWCRIILSNWNIFLCGKYGVGIWFMCVTFSQLHYNQQPSSKYTTESASLNKTTGFSCSHSLSCQLVEIFVWYREHFLSFFLTSKIYSISKKKRFSIYFGKMSLDRGFSED